MPKSNMENLYALLGKNFHEVNIFLGYEPCPVRLFG
jgi:hypothetical protein